MVTHLAESGVVGTCCLATHTHTHRTQKTKKIAGRPTFKVCLSFVILTSTYVVSIRLSSSVQDLQEDGSSTSKRFRGNGGSGRTSCRKTFLGVREKALLIFLIGRAPPSSDPAKVKRVHAVARVLRVKHARDIK